MSILRTVPPITVLLLSVTASSSAFLCTTPHSSDHSCAHTFRKQRTSRAPNTQTAIFAAPSLFSEALGDASCLISNAWLLSDADAISTASPETWRQYVPLAVSSIVILDILLGSPLLNTIAAPLRRASGQEDLVSKKDEEEDEKGSMFGFMSSDSSPKTGKRRERGRGERIDTNQYAQAAVEKARYTLELKRFLEESKTDWDKMQDIQRKIDQDMAALDEDLAARKNEIDGKKK